MLFAIIDHNETDRVFITYVRFLYKLGTSAIVLPGEIALIGTGAEENQ